MNDMRFERPVPEVQRVDKQGVPLDVAIFGVRLLEFLAVLVSGGIAVELVRGSLSNSDTALYMRVVIMAAIAYAIQNIIGRRASQAAGHAAAPLESPIAASLLPPVMAGKKCGECGAHAVIRKDGCDYCTQCGHLGTCG